MKDKRKIETSFDIDRARRQTPGCREVIHLNNAGASLMPRCVIDSVKDHLELETMMGGYEAADRAKGKIEFTYDAASKLLNCDRDEIAVVENATRAWDMVFYSIPFSRGDRILTSVSEYASNFIAYLQVAKKTGAEIEVVPNDEYGQVSLSALARMLEKPAKLISITHVPTNGGLVNPAAEIGKLAKEARVMYLLDACQSVGQMPIDVQYIGCDLLSATGRKFLRAPRGTGLLYVRRDALEKLEPPFLDLHAATWVKKDRYTIRENARRFENWESYVAGKIGLGTAIDYALGWDLEKIRLRVSALAAELRRRLRKMPHVTVQDLGEVLCGIVSFTVEGIDPGFIQQKLRDKRINVSVSLFNYTLLDMASRKLPSLVRASVHYFNTEREIDRFVFELESIISMESP